MWPSTGASQECQESKGLESWRRMEPSHFRGTTIVCQIHPQSNAFQGEPLANSCIISWPWCPVLQGTWGGLWLHAQSTNSFSTCLLGICYTKLEINNSSCRMNNSTEGTKVHWHHKNSLCCLLKGEGKRYSTARLVSGPK